MVNSNHIEHIADLNEGCRITFAAQKVDGRANSIVVRQTFLELGSLLRGQEAIAPQGIQQAGPDLIPRKAEESK
jgi:hypothetical protein